jgi:phage baseplate assembly protein W
VSVVLDMPFHVDGAGQIAVLTDVQSQMALRVRSVIGTSPGERVMRPTYGAGAANYLFEVDDLAHAVQLQTAVADALAAWEPAIVVEDVSPTDLDPENGILTLRVSYRLAATGEIQRAVITVASTATYGWPSS